MKTILEYLEQTVRAHPDRPACIEEGRSCTYRELYRLSRAIGSALARTVVPREPVAVYLPQGADALTAFLGVVYAGGFYVFLNPELPPPRLRQVQAVLGARCVITDLPRRQAAEALFPSERLFLLEELVQTPPEEAVLSAVQAAGVDTDPLYANFTSGSTGVPKGVVVSHRSVLDFIDAFTRIFDLRETDRIANQAPFDFDVSVKDIYSALKTGAALIILPRRLFSRPGELADYLCTHRATILIWAVSALCLLSSLHALEYRKPDTVRQVLFSGEVMPLKDLRAWMDALPHARFVNLYGPTEITCNCTYHVLERGRDYREGVPIGRPFPNEEVFLLDGSDQEVRLPGVVGEVCVRGSALALGYYRAPEQTAAAFTPDPRNNAYRELIYRTGDLGRYGPEGELYYCGRKDLQIKYLGHRVELEEVERAVSALPQVDRCCCVFDPARRKLWGFYTGEAEPEVLGRQLRAVLPSYMVPGVLRRLSSFPLSKNGKIDRSQLLKGGYPPCSIKS